MIMLWVLVFDLTIGVRVLITPQTQLIISHWHIVSLEKQVVLDFEQRQLVSLETCMSPDIA